MEKVVTPVFRLSFPNLFKARKFDENQEAKYSCVMLFAKDGERKADLTEMKKLAMNAVVEKWGSDREKWPKLRTPFRDGDVEKSDIDGYPGHVFITASTKMAPGMVDQRLQPILSEEELYAGCYCRATVTCYAYSKAGNKGVAFGLNNLQKVAEGEPFTGRTKPEEDFEAIITADNIDSLPEDFDPLGDSGVTAEDNAPF